VIQFRFSRAGCLWSLVASIVLTIVLNLLLRGCVALFGGVSTP
jgi:hypothetical protein